MRRAHLLEMARASTAHKVLDDGCRTIVTKIDTGVAVAIYESGAPHRADIDLSLTVNMTLISAARVLDLVGADAR